MNVDPKDAEQGVYEKFRVERTDGRSAPGEKHHGCTYFVLDVDHDPYAIPALKAYAEACRAAFPALAADVMKMRNGHLRFGEAAPGLDSIPRASGGPPASPEPTDAASEVNEKALEAAVDAMADMLTGWDWSRMPKWERDAQVAIARDAARLAYEEVARRV